MPPPCFLHIANRLEGRDGRAAAGMQKLKSQLGSALRWAKKARKDGIARLARKAQANWVNSRSSLEDYKVGDEGASLRNGSKGSGGGKWKQRTVNETLRIGFEFLPTASVRSVAASLQPRASHPHVANLLYVNACLVRRALRSAVDASLNDEQLSFGVGAFCIDESQFRLHMRAVQSRPSSCVGWTPASSLFAVTCRVLVADEDFRTEEDDVVIEPRCGESNTSAVQWACLLKQLPTPIADVLSGLPPPQAMRMFALCSGTDEHAANHMTLAHAEKQMHEKCILLKGLCKQHGAGNVLTMLSDHVGVNNPSYCLGKKLRNGQFVESFEAGVFDYFEQFLEHLRPGDTWRPLTQHTEFAKAVMDLTFFYRDVRASVDGDFADEGAPDSGEKLRKLGEEFLRSVLARS